MGFNPFFPLGDKDKNPLKSLKKKKKEKNLYLAWNESYLMLFIFLTMSWEEPMGVFGNFTFIYIIAMWNGKLAYARKKSGAYYWWASSEERVLPDMVFSCRRWLVLGDTFCVSQLINKKHRWIELNLVLACVCEVACLVIAYKSLMTIFIKQSKMVNTNSGNHGKRYCCLIVCSL